MISSVVSWSPSSEAAISALVRSSPGFSRFDSTIFAKSVPRSAIICGTSSGGVCVEKNFSKRVFSRGWSAASTPISSLTTFIGSGYANSAFRSTVSPAGISASRSSMPVVSFSMPARSRSTRRTVSACATSVRSLRCSLPSTVSIERPGLASPISGQSSGISPRCQAPHTLMSFTSRASVRSCLASA